MVAQAVSREAASGHIRPFVPHRDLAGLASLIERSFGPELQVTGSHIVQDLRQMAAFGPLLRATGPFAAPFAGFVWVEEGRMVGNVSLGPERDGSRSWTVSNVAVLPEYRGLGIAGQLMDRAIAFAERQGVRRLQLEVRVDNAPAQALYKHRGFVVVDTVHELRLPRYGWATPAGRPPAGLGPARYAERRAIARLVDATSAAATASGAAIQGLRRGFAAWLAGRAAAFLSGERIHEAVGRASGEVVAYGYAATHPWRGPHEVGVYVAPSVRGAWEGPLLEWLLRRLRRTVPQAVRATISDAHPEAVAAARRLGFQPLRVLDHMVLDLAPRAEGAPSGARRS